MTLCMHCHNLIDATPEEVNLYKFYQNDINSLIKTVKIDYDVCEHCGFITDEETLYKEFKETINTDTLKLHSDFSIICNKNYENISSTYEKLLNRYIKELEQSFNECLPKSISNSNKTNVFYYCDGSSQGIKDLNRNGRFAVIRICGETVSDKYQSGVFPNATNSEMEVRALLETLEMIINNKDTDAIVCSDSRYVVNSYNKWLDKWAKDNWKKKLVQEIRWKEIYRLKTKMESDGFNIKVLWIKGHANDKYNQIVDKLAEER